MGNKRSYFKATSSILKIALGLLVFCFAFDVSAQNTKGDKPAAAPAPAKSKKKIFGKKKSNGARLGSSRGSRARNVFPQNGPFVNNPSPRPKKVKANTTRYPGAVSPNAAPSQRSRAWTSGTATGQRIKPRSSSGKIQRVFPQRGRFVNNPSPTLKQSSAGKVQRVFPQSGKFVKNPSPTLKKSSAGRVQRVFPQKGPFVNNPSPTLKQSSAGRVQRVFPQSGKFVNRSSNSSKARSRNIYSQHGPYVNNPSRVAKVPGSNPKNQPLHSARRLSMSQKAAQARSMGIRNAGFATISSQFLSRGRKNVYWGKIQKSHKAVTTDIAGRNLRRKNFHSPKITLVGRDTLPFFRRSPKVGGRPVPSQRPVRSVSRSGKFFGGDISGSKLRKRKYTGNSAVPGKFVWPRKLSISSSGKVGRNRSGGPRSITETGKPSLEPLLGRPPGFGGKAFQKFSNKAGPLKKQSGFGGSISGRLLNNNNRSIAARRGGKGTLAAGTFQGRTKTGKPLKGGGSVSGQPRNNRNQPIAARRGGQGTLAAGTFQGKFKTGKPLKGGGSISGQPRNNRGQAIEVRRGGTGTLAAGTFQGKYKGGKPWKGGGSVSGKLWNNNGKPVAVRPGGLGTYFAGTFQGRAKTGKPQKGGGSISGQPRNNRGQAIEVRRGGTGTLAAGTFQGRTKTGKPVKGGGSVSGQLLSNKGRPIDVRKGGKGTLAAGTYQGKTKYTKPEHTAGKPAKYSGNIKGVLGGSPDLNEFVGADYTGDYKRKKGGIENKQRSLISKLFKKPSTLPEKHRSRDEAVASGTQKGKKYFFSRYVQNPKAADASLKKDRLPNGLMLNVPIINQTKRSVNAGHYVHYMKQNWDYKRNPNQSKQALKLREPGRSQARIGDLQVNVKMKKFTNAQLHPDAKFAHSFRDNVKEERTIFMNFRLFWSKLFKKSDNQPRGLKIKPGRPRFDPKEQGMWYD